MGCRRHRSVGVVVPTALHSVAHATDAAAGRRGCRRRGRAGDRPAGAPAAGRRVGASAGRSAGAARPRGGAPAAGWTGGAAAGLAVRSRGEPRYSPRARGGAGAGRTLDASGGAAEPIARSRSGKRCRAIEPQGYTCPLPTPSLCLARVIAGLRPTIREHSDSAVGFKRAPHRAGPLVKDLSRKCQAARRGSRAGIPERCRGRIPRRSPRPGRHRTGPHTRSLPCTSPTPTISPFTV
jgi:hypothetical protein